MPNGITRSLIAQQQRQRVDENRLAGTGFASQEIQTSGEFHGDVVDNRIIFNAQFK